MKWELGNIMVTWDRIDLEQLIWMDFLDPRFCYTFYSPYRIMFHPVSYGPYVLRVCHVSKSGYFKKWIFFKKWLFSKSGYFEGVDILKKWIFWKSGYFYVFYSICWNESYHVQSNLAIRLISITRCKWEWKTGKLTGYFERS